MNTKATLALAASISAIGVAVADVAKAIAAHPATQADDSGDILKAAEELQGFATQLEGVATAVNGGAPVDAGSGDGTGGTTAAAGDGTTAAAGDGTTAAAGDGTTGTGEQPAPEAGSEEGPGALEATPALVEEPAPSGDQTVTS